MDFLVTDSAVPSRDMADPLPSLLDTTRPLLETWAQALRQDADAHYCGQSSQLSVLARQDLLQATHHLLLLLDRHVAPLAPAVSADAPEQAVRS